MEEYKRRWKSKRLGDNFPSFFHDSFAFFPDVDYKNNQYLGAAYDKNKFGFKKDLESIEEKILSFFNEGRKVTGLLKNKSRIQVFVKCSLNHSVSNKALKMKSEITVKHI